MSSQDFPTVNAQQIFPDDDIAYDDFAGSSLSLWESQAGNSEAVSAQMTDWTESEEVLDESIWGDLPTELQERTLAFLPPGALFRFRAVCSRWKTLLSTSEWLLQWSQIANSRPRSSCSLVREWGASDGTFFCQSEWKWFKIPLPLEWRLHWELVNVDFVANWELVDSDAGLVCYQCKRKIDPDVNIWLCVCNPLTKSTRVLPPHYPHSNVVLNARFSNCKFIKLVVDRVTKSFKVVVLEYSCTSPTTLVYDSTTSLWTDCQTFPSLWTAPQSFPSKGLKAGSFFLWKSTIYSQCFQPNLLVAFDVDSKKWRDVRIDLPCHHMRRLQIVNHNGSIILLQLDFPVEDLIFVWRLIGDESFSSNSKWEELTVRIPQYLRQMVSGVQSCFSQTNCLCFSTSSKFSKKWVCPSSGKLSFSCEYSNHWVSYSIEEGCWSLMPSREGDGAPYACIDWEPRLDIDV